LWVPPCDKYLWAINPILKYFSLLLDKDDVRASYSVIAAKKAIVDAHPIVVAMKRLMLTKGILGYNKRYSY
jgi:hypothetical protein